MSSAYTAEQYIDDVLSGRQVACKYVRLAVERHLRDLEQIGDPDFPYYFDEDHARRAIDFKQQLRHTKGEWANPRKHDTRIRLEPWQQFRDWVRFGWRRAEDGSRRFRKSITEVARKNGKTTDAAATANFMLFADRPLEMGPEVYCVATKKDQAKIALEEAARQIKKHPVLAKRSREYKQNSTIVRHDDPAAKMTIWGKDADTQDGFNPSYVVFDEAHAQTDNSMMEVIESGMGARTQPLIDMITTAGLDLNAPYYQEERTLAVAILERTIEPVPEDVFAIIYTLDEEDDWTDESVWVKANPNLGVSVSWEYLRSRVQQALQMPSRQNKILTKNFNIWTQAKTRWIADEVWMRCSFPVDEQALRGRKCFLGMDLSASQDITALALCFPPINPFGKYEFLYRFFIPEEGLLEKERSDKVPYTHWVKEGLVITTPGPVIDYDWIEDEIRELAGRYEIQEIPHDPWKAQEIVNHLGDEGFEMVAIRQAYSGMAQYTDTFEKKVLAGQVAHGGHPVMRWMVSCTEVKSDRQGNIMPMKPERQKSGKRIDGVPASIMALGRAVVGDDGGSEYDERGVLAL